MLADQPPVPSPSNAPIAGFPGYYAGVDGKIYSTRKGSWRTLKTARMPKGYLAVNLYNSDGLRRFLVHRLVLAALTGPCPPGHECDHVNGVRDDNRVENLRWVTPSENNLAKYARHGGAPWLRGHTHNSGERNGAAKLTAKDVQEIRVLLRTKTQQWIADLYGVAQTTISRLARGINWQETA